jgi:hypothetical protein
MPGLFVCDGVGSTAAFRRAKARRRKESRACRSDRAISLGPIEGREFFAPLRLRVNPIGLGAGNASGNGQKKTGRELLLRPVIWVAIRAA